MSQYTYNASATLGTATIQGAIAASLKSKAYHFLICSITRIRRNNSEPIIDIWFALEMSHVNFFGVFEVSRSSKNSKQKTQPGIQKIQNHSSGVRQLLKAKYVPFYRWKKVGWGEEEAQQSHICHT